MEVLVQKIQNRTQAFPFILLSFLFTPSIPTCLHPSSNSSPYLPPPLSLLFLLFPQIPGDSDAAGGSQELVITAEEHRLVVNSSDYKSVSSSLCK